MSENKNQEPARTYTVEIRLEPDFAHARVLRGGYDWVGSPSGDLPFVMSAVAEAMTRDARFTDEEKERTRRIRAASTHLDTLCAIVTDSVRDGESLEEAMSNASSIAKMIGFTFDNTVREIVEKAARDAAREEEIAPGIRDSVDPDAAFVRAENEPTRAIPPPPRAPGVYIHELRIEGVGSNETVGERLAAALREFNERTVSAFRERFPHYAPFEDPEPDPIRRPTADELVETARSFLALQVEVFLNSAEATLEKQLRRVMFPVLRHVPLRTTRGWVVARARETTEERL